MNRDSPGSLEHAASSRGVLLAQYEYVRCGVNGRGVT